MLSGMQTPRVFESFCDATPATCYSQFKMTEKGLGLLGMEERVTHLHGQFEVDSRPGEGASIRVALPLSEKSVALGV